MQANRTTSSSFWPQQSTNLSMSSMSQLVLEPPIDIYQVLPEIERRVLLGWDVNTMLQDRSYLIHHVTAYPHLMKIILERNAKVNVVDGDGRTPFFYCTTTVSVTLLTANLEENDAKVVMETIDREGLTAPEHLADFYLQPCDELLRTIAYLLSRISTKSESILGTLAQISKKTALLQLFVEHGYDVNAPNRFGKTPIMLALKDSIVPQVLNLIKLGARLTKEDQLLCIALSKPDPYDGNNAESRKELAEYIYRNFDLNESGWTPLHFAISQQDNKQIQKFANDSVINKVPREVECPGFLLAGILSPVNKTPLELALDNVDTVFILLEKGAGPNESCLRCVKMPHLKFQKRLFELYASKNLSSEERYHLIEKEAEDQIQTLREGMRMNQGDSRFYQSEIDAYTRLRNLVQESLQKLIEKK